MSWTPKSVVFVCVCALARTQVIPGKSRTNDGDYNSVNTDGSFDFGYANKDRGQSYHLAHSNAQGVVGGRFGARDPATDTVKETIYSAGPRGFRAKGPNIHRKMDLDQRPRGPIGNKDDPYFDPNEDPSYGYKFETRTYSKNENADSRGDVKGHYSYVDDVGERHDVSYIAGRDTGFHVSSAHPDNPSLIGSPFHRSPLVRAETRPRGRTAVQRFLDGSYKFISAGPDQRRTESSDAHGNVRGFYTFLDDKGVQRTVHYIAGPKIGYRIVKNGKDPYIPSYFPTIPSAYDPDFIGSAGSTNFSPDDSGPDDVFKGPDGTAASGHVKPPPFPTNDKDRDRPNKKPGSNVTPGSSGFGDSDGPGGSASGGSGFDGSSDDTFGGGNGNYGSSTGNNNFGGGASSGSFGASSGNDKFGGSSSGGNFGSGTGNDKFGSGTSNDKFGSGTSNGNYGAGAGNDKFGSGAGNGNYGTGTSSDNYGGSTTGGNYGNRPGSGSGSSSSFGGKPDSSSGGSSNAGGSSSAGGDGGDSSYESPGFDTGDETISYVDEEPSFGGNKPTKGPGKPPRPTSKPIRPPKPISENDVNNVIGIGFNIHPNRPGATIIRNIGPDFIHIPSGVSVRAHVQSIDLYPYNTQPISPSEAMQKDKT